MTASWVNREVIATHQCIGRAVLAPCVDGVAIAANQGGVVTVVVTDGAAVTLEPVDGVTKAQPMHHAIVATR